MYQKKHFNKGDASQDDNIGRHEEECEESNKEDWRIQVKVEEECDGIEDILSDEEEGPLRNRWRLELLGGVLRRTSKVVM
jgi:hypothetical protein